MEERKENGRGAGCAIAGVGLLLLPVLYVLGLGPAIWIADRYPGAHDFLDAVYTPLGMLAGNCEPISRGLEWYAGFWE